MTTDLDSWHAGSSRPSLGQIPRSRSKFYGCSREVRVKFGKRVAEVCFEQVPCSGCLSSYCAKAAGATSSEGNIDS